MTIRYSLIDYLVSQTPGVEFTVIRDGDEVESLMGVSSHVEGGVQVDFTFQEEYDSSHNVFIGTMVIRDYQIVSLSGSDKYDDCFEPDAEYITRAFDEADQNTVTYS